jgi:hypothetical protein
MSAHSDPPVRNQVAYLVCAEGANFEDVIAGLGGYVWGTAPMHLTGSHLVILPESVALECGVVRVGELLCRFTYVRRL